jgi:hypothetical protein
MSWPLCALAVFFSVHGVFSLAAIWAARRRGHWCPGAVTLLLLCGVWLVVPDFRLWLVFVTLTLSVMLSLKCVGWREGAPQSASTADGAIPPVHKLPRFSLADLLLAVLIVGIFLPS